MILPLLKATLRHFKSAGLPVVAATALLFALSGCAAKPTTTTAQSPTPIPTAAPSPVAGAAKQSAASDRGTSPGPQADTETARPSIDRPSAPTQKKPLSQPDPERLAAKASPARTAVSRKLESVRIGTLDFQDEALSNVFKILTAVAGVNFTVEEHYTSGNSTWLPSQLEKAYDTKADSDSQDGEEIQKSKVTIYLKDVTLKDALSAICKDKGLRWELEDDGCIRVADKNDQMTVALDEDSFAGLNTNAAFSGGIIRELDVGGKKLKKVLEALSGGTGVNIVCKPYLENWSIHIHLENVTMRTAIEAICEKYYMWYTSTPSKDYICLIGNEEFASETYVDYRVKTRVLNLQYASAPQVADAIGSVMGNRVEYILPANLGSYEHLKLPDLETTEGKIESKQSDTEVTKQIDIPELKSENLSVDKIRSIIDKALDLRLTAADIRWINKEAGFAIMSIFLRNNAVLVCSTDELLLGEIEALVREMDVPTPQVLLECRILGVTLTDGFQSFFRITDIGYNQEGGTSFGGESKVLSATSIGSGGVVDALYSITSDAFQLNMRLDMLQKDGLVNTIATPMILAAQNSQAEIASGIRNVPIFSGIQVVSPTYDDEGNILTNGYTTPQYTDADLVGIRLCITPQVSQDRSVTLRMDLEQSAINSDGAQIKYTTFNENGQPSMNWSTETVDTLQVNSLQTIAVVPEGYMLALGGFIEEEQSVKENKVPILGDIPVLGFFFRDKQKEKLRKEMIILITPRVLMAPSEANRVTSETLEGSEHPTSSNGRRYMLEYDERAKKLHRAQ
jgi:hypothetical protein